MTEREKLLESMIWPNKPEPNDGCLYCHIAKRKRFSWFCRIECENEYIKEY